MKQVTTDPDPSKAAIEVTTDSDRSTSGTPRPPTHPEPSASVCEPYRELVELGLRRGRNAMAIWQDLISDHGFAGSYETVKRFVRTLRGPQGPEAAGVIFRILSQTVWASYHMGRRAMSVRLKPVDLSSIGAKSATI